MNNAEYLSEQIAAFCEATQVPGVVVGVHHAGERVRVAHGVANTATGAPMRADTGFCSGPSPRS